MLRVWRPPRADRAALARVTGLARPLRGLTAVVVISMLVVGAMVLRPHRADAGPIDPRLRFQLVKTPHFTLYFHQGEESIARRLADLVEGVRTEVGESMRTEPPAHTHVILADQTEYANGWASPLPRDTVFLNAAAPSGAEFIGNTDDWLRVVFTHEFTHIVHLDRSGGWARAARAMLGRSPYVFPNLTLPQWAIEGIATWHESALSGGGRASADDFRSIELVAAGAGRPLLLDRSNGGLVAWPGGNAGYATGLGFHEYLAHRFGAETLARLADSTSRRLPYLGVGAFKAVYGQSLGSLWANYNAELSRRARATPAAVPSAVRVTGPSSAVVTGPRFMPRACDRCADEILYSLQGADGFPTLRVTGADGTHDRTLALRNLGATAGVSAEAIVFDQQERHRNAGLYADLYILDRRTGVQRRLSSAARLQDPDLSPDGRLVIATRQAGDRRELVLVPLGDGHHTIDVSEIETLASDPSVSFSAPRWSPDGTRIAVERRRVGALPSVLVLEAATRSVLAELAAVDARIVTPTWRPDGRAVVAAADFERTPFDIYEFDLDGERGIRRLTTTAGALWPDVRADGQLLAFAGYTDVGFALFTAPYLPGTSRLPAVSSGSSAVPRATTPVADSPVSRSSGYSPLGTIAPTSWSPVVFDAGDGLRAGGLVTGSDVLGRHAYSVDASMAVQARAVSRAPRRAALDWSASYAYTRWVPTLFASASRQTQTAVVASSNTGETSTIALIEDQVQAGIVVPIARVRRQTSVLASVLRSDNRYLFADRDRTVRLASARIAVAHSTARRYGYSISREHGFAIGGTAEVSSRALGSEADATTGTVDARGFLPGFGLHHVVAVRAGAGVSTGDALARQRFRLGSTAAASSVVDFGSNALGLLRGDSGHQATGSRITTGAIEYRFPLWRVERGHGTWPLFIKMLHAAAFVDVGRVGGITAAPRAWHRSEGGELSVDGVAGYAAPFTLSVGVASVHVGGARRGAAAFLRLGHSF